MNLPLVITDLTVFVLVDHICRLSQKLPLIAPCIDIVDQTNQLPTTDQIGDAATL